jgi:hypothetical protein
MYVFNAGDTVRGLRVPGSHRRCRVGTPVCHVPARTRDRLAADAYF